MTGASHWVGSCHTRKHQTRLERLARDKQSSLLRKFVMFIKCFVGLAPGPKLQSFLRLQFTNVYNKLEPFQPPRLMFLGEDRSLPESGALEGCLTQVSTSLAHKHQTWLEMLDREKHSSLLQTFIYYNCKSVITFGPDQDIKQLNPETYSINIFTRLDNFAFQDKHLLTNETVQLIETLRNYSV